VERRSEQRRHRRGPSDWRIGVELCQRRWAHRIVGGLTKGNLREELSALKEKNLDDWRRLIGPTPADVSQPLVMAIVQELLSKHRDELPRGADGQNGRDATAPGGVVVASIVACDTLPTDSQRKGWSPFIEAGGRFIVGAGPHFNTYQPRNTDTEGNEILGPQMQLPSKQPFDTGGEPVHTLRITEIPNITILSGTQRTTLRSGTSLPGMPINGVMRMTLLKSGRM
jgi:hypothetical protein